MNTEYEEKLRELMRIFLEENTKINLSAYRTEESCWTGNILDSLAFLDILPTLLTTNDSRQTVIDIGTGGGFPLLPLVICLPDIHFTGIDSTRKKVDAVRRIMSTLQLSNINLIWGRAEDCKHQYDLVLARAIAPLKKLLPIAAPLVKPDGHIVLWKSMTIDTEFNESKPIQKKFGLSLLEQHVYELPGDWGKRKLLIFNKMSEKWVH